MSIKMMRFCELFDECAAAPSGGARGAGGGRVRGAGAGAGGGRHRVGVGVGVGAQRRREAWVGAAAALAAAMQPLPAVALLGALPQVGVGAVHLQLPVGEQAARVGRSVQARVGGRGAFVALHFGHLGAADVVGGGAALRDRLFGVVMVGTVSGECVILYFTERKVAAVHCRCDIKAAACNKIERFKVPRRGASFSRQLSLFTSINSGANGKRIF